MTAPRRTWMVGLAFAGALGLSACGTSAKTASSDTPHSVTVALQANTSPNWFFPLGSTTTFTTTNYEVNSLAYLPLLSLKSNLAINWKESLASSVTWNSKDTEFTIHLNPKARWSNGRPVTSRDVVLAWQLIHWGSEDLTNLAWQYGGAGSGGVPTDWKSVAPQGSREVLVSLTHPVNPYWFERNGLGQLIPVPAFVWDRYPHNPQKEFRFIAGVAVKPESPLYHIVDGPYRFSSYSPNRDWVYTANRAFWGTRAQIPRVVFEYETSTISEFTALKEGTVDVGYVPLSLWGDRRQLNQDVTWHNYGWGASFIQVNFRPSAPDGAAMDHLYVRQALEYGINQAAVVDQIYHGMGITLDGPIPSQPKTPYFDPALGHLTYPFSINRGKELLQAHGWHLFKGVMTRGGQSLSFTFEYPSGSTTAENVAQLLQSSWHQEGINVTLKAMNMNEMLSQSPNAWTLYWLGLSTWAYVPDYYPNGGALFEPASPLNVGNYNDPTMTQLIEAGYAPAASPEQALSRLYAYENYASQKLPVLFMPYAANLYAHAKGLSGVESTQNLVSGMIYPNLWHYNR